MRIYDTPQYRKLRRALQVIHRAGDAVCWRCGRPIAPTEQMHVGHDDVDKSIIRGPEHMLCNVRTATYKARRRRKRTAWLW